MPPIDRRLFLQRTAGLLVTTAFTPSLAHRSRAASPPVQDGVIQTVLGTVPASELGFTLPHEHVQCDFIGAEKTGPQRWDAGRVVDRMQPFLEELVQRKVTGFVDCTPAYIGRDPRVLKTLAQNTGLHILTNTGYYGGANDKYVPAHAYRESSEQLSQRWIQEWQHGIDDTGIKPGFMKIGVDSISAETPQLSDIDAKLVRAAAIVSNATGLTAVCHTGGGAAGLAAARLFIREGGAPAKFVVAHADGHGIHANQEAAQLGVWVSYDAISRRPLEQHLTLVQSMIQDHANRLLLSHDNGWYSVGEDNGGDVRDYNYLTDTFLPALRQHGVENTVLANLTVNNPAQAFAIAALSN